MRVSLKLFFTSMSNKKTRIVWVKIKAVSVLIEFFLSSTAATFFYSFVVLNNINLIHCWTDDSSSSNCHSIFTGNNKRRLLSEVIEFIDLKNRLMIDDRKADGNFIQALSAVVFRKKIHSCSNYLLQIDTLSSTAMYKKAK